jgi:hypothetical protein
VPEKAHLGRASLQLHGHGLGLNGEAMQSPFTGETMGQDDSRTSRGNCETAGPGK